ncbi:MAG: hypothetical protein ACXABY_19615 [Candidatus Thorarchaeota archaeon]|jgi:hypothetical protein
MASAGEAFVRGFLLADQLETNKLRREFLHEEISAKRQERSRLHTILGRQDEECERLELDRKKKENLVKFDAMTRQIVEEKSAEIEDLRASGNERLADELTVQWFGDANIRNGKAAGFTLVANEALKRLTAADPEFGEHVSLALGHDAAAGPLVSDPTKPVSGVGLIPAEVDPKGTGGIAVEVNSVNGPQPLTENRTDRDTDPVAIRPVGLKQLTDVFGEEVLKNNFLVAQQMRALADVQVDGQPFASQERRSTNLVDRGESRETSTLEDRGESRETTTLERRNIFEGASDEVLHDNDTQGEGFLDRQEAELKRRREAAGTPEPDSDAALRTTMFDKDAPLSSRAASGIRLLASDISKVGQSIFGTGVAAAETAAVPVDVVGGFIVDVAQEAITGERPETQGEGLDAKVAKLISGENKSLAEPGYSGKQTLDAPATTAKDVINTGATPSDFTRSKTSQPGVSAAKAIVRAPIPGSTATAQQIANRVVNTKGNPSFVDIFNAASLTKAGIITPAQLFRYSQTGSFEEPVNKQLLALGDGAFAIFNPRTGGVTFGQAGGTAGAGLADVKDQQGLLNLLQDATSGLFDDDPQGQQQFIDAAEGAFTILGLPGNTEEQLKARATPDVFNSIVRGAGFVKRFDEDTTQNLLQGTGDFNPLPSSDLKLPMNAGNIALGFAADQMGVTTQPAANEFLAAYAGDFNAHFKLNGRELYLNAIDKEATVLARVAASQNPAHPQHKRFKGQSRDKIRRELVEDLIDENSPRQ